MLRCDRVQENAYRVLRLSVSRTWSEIHGAASEMRRAVLTGRCGMTDDDSPLLGEIIRSEASVRAAVDALGNDWQRIEHRLFWFHRRPADEDPENPHDNALRALIAAYAEPQGATGPMVAALRQWHQFVTQPEYWAIVDRIECDGGFEPAVPAGKLLALQDKAMAMAAEPFAETAREAWLSKDLAAVHDYLAAFAALESTGRWAADCRQKLIVPVTTQLTDTCETLGSKYRTQIVYRNDAAVPNEHVCARELQYYREFVETAWKELDAVLTQNEAEVRLGRGQTADSLAGVAVDHTWADQLILAQDLAIEAEKLAVGTIVEPRLLETLRSLVEAGEKRRQSACDNAAATFRSALETFRDLYPERALADQPAINDIKPICAAALSYYRDSLEPALHLVVQLSEDTQQLIGCRAHAARCLSLIATEFARAGEFSIAENMAHQAISLADGTEAAVDMQEGLARLRGWVEKQPRTTSRAAVDGAMDGLHRRFATLAHTFAGKIVAREGYGHNNQLVCREELAYFRTQIEPTFHEVLSRLKPYDQVALDLREQAAVCLSSIATHHTWADEFLVAQRLMEEALTLAQGTWAASSIQKKYLWMRKPAPTGHLNKRWSLVSFPSLTTAILLLITAAVLFSLLANTKTASTSGVRPVQAGTAADGSSSSAPPVPDAMPHPIQQTAGQVEAPVSSSMERLQDEIESLKKQRAAGVEVDSNLLNAKLYQYSSLLRKRRREVQLLNQKDASLNKPQ